MDPLVIIGAVVTALTTVAGLLFKELQRRATDAEADADYWRDQTLAATGLNVLQAEELRKLRSKRRTR